MVVGVHVICVSERSYFLNMRMLRIRFGELFLKVFSKMVLSFENVMICVMGNKNIL